MEQTASEQRRPGRKRRFWRILLTLMLWAWAFSALGILAAGVLAFAIYDHVTHTGKAGAPVEVVVPPGATGREVGRLLAEHQLIAYEGFFRLAIQLDRQEKPIRHGAYELHEGLSPMQLLKVLQEGPSRHLLANQVRITIPEGLTIAQMAAMFDDSQGIIEAARDPGLMQRLGMEADTLEGFLMPNTYFFDEPPAPRVLVERMVAQFEKDFAALLAENPGAAHLDKRYLVTVASIVERETKVEEERPLVAQVIYNRLNRNMPLQMDSTLQYALNKYGERLLYSDLESKSPYNTYARRGLPPGPISNPGKSSLRAAVAPADVNYLYFVSNADGRTHTFSHSAEEHARAVARFRRLIEPQRQEQRRKP